MKKYTYLVNFDSQTLEHVGESFAVKGDGGIAELEFVIPSNFGVPANQALWRVFFKPPGEKESLFETLPTVAATQSGDYVTSWTISKAITQKAGRLAFSLAAISGNDIQWNSRTVIMQVPESQYQPESEEAEEPYTGRLDALEGSMASIRGEFDDVVDEFEELKETATLGTPIPKSLASEMVEGGVYLYTGSETGYTAGHVYYYVGGALTDGGQYGGIALDATLTSPTMAAPASEVGQIKEDLSELQSDGAVLTARQLLSDKYVVDQMPYKFRASYSGDRMDDSIVGGSVVWNQLVRNGNFSNGTTGWTTAGGSSTVSNGTVILTKNSTAGSLPFYQSIAQKSEGHKVFISFNGFASTPLMLLIYWGDKIDNVRLTTTRTAFGIIGTVASGNTNFNLQGQNVPASGTISYSNIQLFDLTRMFGAEVADYIYGLEQANAGDGVAYVRKMLPEEYYVYSEPTLKHVEGLSAHVMRDADNNVIGNYSLDATLTLRGIPKLGDNGLYFDGDEYKADGTVERKYGIRAYQSGDDSLTDAITDGTNTVYKLTTPTAETATPYTALQIVDASGTEEYVSTSIVPVGHYTKYYDDLRKKLDGLPWNFANLIAPTESTYTATRNYTTGSLLIVDNTLYSVTANIANGGAITPNTNVIATTLAEVISAL